jgi:hypothetical protein
MKEITNTEILDYASGDASEETTHSVVAAAVLDIRVAEKLRIAYTLYDAQEVDTIATEIATKTRPRLLALVQSTGQPEAQSDVSSDISRETVFATFAQVGGGLFRRGKALQAQVQEWSEEVLHVGRQLLTLPCLAPATAAAGVEHSLRRESITTPEGIRVEFQQLPGNTPRLRLLLDASVWAEREYTKGFVTLEEGDDRHILVVALNAQSRGFTDFVIGEGESDLPPARRGIHVVSISLARD